MNLDDAGAQVLSLLSEVEDLRSHIAELKAQLAEEKRWGGIGRKAAADGMYLHPDSFYSLSVTPPQVES